MMEEKTLSEQESLRLITDMINKAKSSFHENGSSAILWGSVIAFCGLISFAQIQWNFSIGFDVWLLTLFAFIPQAYITIRQRKNKRVVSHIEAAMNAIWIVYAISIFALVFYFNVVPSATDKLLTADGIHLTKATADGKITAFNYFIPSSGSLLLLLYAIPTLATGMACKFRPMTIAAILCYVFFIVSCFVPAAYDMLLNGLAGIFNWLLPGIILRMKFNKQKKAMNV
jgi:uncharacterized protein with PQ loop repeat